MRHAEYTLINRNCHCPRTQQVAEATAKKLSKFVTKPYTLFIDKYGHCDLVMRDGHLIFEGSIHELSNTVYALQKLY